MKYKLNQRVKIKHIGGIKGEVGIIKNIKIAKGKRTVYSIELSSLNHLCNCTSTYLQPAQDSNLGFISSNLLAARLLVVDALATAMDDKEMATSLEEIIHYITEADHLIEGRLREMRE